jgi:hypothetical protein
LCGRVYVRKGFFERHVCKTKKSRPRGRRRRAETPLESEELFHFTAADFESPPQEDMSPPDILEEEVEEDNSLDINRAPTEEDLAEVDDHDLINQPAFLEPEDEYIDIDGISDEERRFSDVDHGSNKQQTDMILEVLPLPSSMKGKFLF